MRVAVVSDVHANLPALEAALRAAERLGAEAVWCPGDLVGYGASPNECVRRMQAAGAVTVAGNHDLIALGRLGDDRCVPLAQRSLAWTARALADDVREWLASLPATARPHEDVLMAHGTPEDPQAYVHTREHAARVLAGHPDARVLIVGHTHRPMEHREGARVLLNAGSVGQSRDRDPRARLLMLDPDAATADFHAVAYDVAAAKRALRDAGLPARSIHMRPSRARALAGRARRVLKGAG